QSYRYGQDLGFVVDRVRQRCCSDIEECGEASWPEMDVDLMGPDSDAVNQGGQEGALACSGQLGPAVADFRSARNEPARRRQIRQLFRLVDAARIEKPLAHSAGHEVFDLRGWDTQPSRSLGPIFGDQRPRN